MPWQEKKKGSVGSDSHHFVAIVVWSIRNHTRKAARRQTFHVSLSDIAVPLKTVPRRHKSSVHSTLYTYRWWLRSVLTTDGFQSARPRSASYTKLPLRTGHTKKKKKKKNLPQILNRMRPRTLMHNQHTLVEFMYLVFTCMPGESYRRWFRALLLYLRYVFWAQCGA